MTPLPPGALKHLLETLPPERPDPFPHLANLTPDALLRRRARITHIAKRLEEERHAIDAELLEVFSAAELRRGVRAPGGWVLQERTRTTWSYPPSIKEQVRSIHKIAQASGEAQEMRTIYLVLTKEDSEILPESTKNPKEDQ